MMPDVETNRLTAWGTGICPYDTAHMVPTWPRAGEKLDALKTVRGGGGPVPTAMAVVSRLGDRAAFVGCVGDDPPGRVVRDDLERRGVDVSGLRVVAGARSAAATLIVEKDTGRRTAIFDHGDVPAPETSDEWLDAHPARFLLLDARAELKPGSLARRAQERGAEVVLDVGSPREPDAASWETADHLILAMGFARWKTGRTDPESAGARLWRDGLKSLVITLGARGCYFFTPEASLFHPAFRVPVEDVTGAGDVFHGAYIYALARDEWSWFERIRFASAAAALACRKLGVRGSLPTLGEIEALMAEQSGDGDSEELA
ncbi:MAG: hypothetical protein GF355_10025 [Candidatus Eisenbacteria bacterium]|nr:hypothetical protein [Candidatus Eisenbacteria bacterium]